MLHTLLESKARTERWGRGAVVSFVLHGAVVAVAIYATAKAGVERDRPQEQTVKFLEHAKADEPQPERRPPPPDVVASVPPNGFQVLPPVLDIPDVIPGLDLTRAPTNPDDWSARGGVAGGTAAGIGDGPAVAGDQPFTAWQVEKPAMGAPGTITPRYPDVLR